ncbi:proclotting enzyme-like isoform X2 [Drosophila innubila]|uniref:proclotting enzyme-like isoform X2 n=1 Tax=Drosophila innubila TaxID=198719 RepID=UPI00148CFF11|nr:proclotting enzyme-like isoform X2 [Drosophila innubila]
MQLLPSVVISLTLIFASLATLTFAQLKLYGAITNSDERPESVIWPNTERPTTAKTTTRVPLNNDDDIPRRLPTLEEAGCGDSLDWIFYYKPTEEHDMTVNYNKTAYYTPYKAPPLAVQGGIEAKKGNYPWIALLFYGDEYSSEHRCAGSLITKRHVITAAHCIREDLSFARLGEHDVSTDEDGPHVDIPIVKTAIYPHFNRLTRRGDIAILYLERNVDKFQPICLPHSPKLRSKSFVGEHAYVAGWGSTREGGKNVAVLQEVALDVFDNEACRHGFAQFYRNFTEDQFDKAIVCAGVLEGGKDSCQGDSGGPLISMVPRHLIGIVSNGIGCGKPGVPAVYASTQYFMDWILEKLEDTP